MDLKIIPEKTAITNGVSSSCKELVKDYTNGIVLDYGFGRLRNSIFIKENNIPLHILDTKAQIKENEDKINSLSIEKVYESTDKLPSNSYSQILLSFVLNVVPSIDDRIYILENINQALTKEGKLYVEVRNGAFIKNLKNKDIYNDGFVTGTINKKTFQKPYTANELSEFLSKNNFKVLKIKKTSGSIICICSKK